MPSPSSDLVVNLRFIYFKHTGKYYCSGECQWTKYAGWNPRQYGKHLNLKGELPGLKSGTWNAPFLVEIVDDYSELVLP